MDNTFLESLTTKLDPVKHKNVYALTKGGATNVTTANTSVNVGTYFPPQISGFSYIKFIALGTIANTASGANEAYTLTLNYGGASVTSTTTVNDNTSGLVACIVDCYKIADHSYIMDITFTRDGATVNRYTRNVTEANFTKLALTAKNDTTAAATNTITPGAGFVLIENN